jgi:hypothetical protein
MTDIKELREAVTEAAAKLAAAEAELMNARVAERAERLASRDVLIEAAPESAFRLDAPTWTGERGYILPFGQGYGKWNPRDVENASFGKSWLSGMVAIICFREDQERQHPSRLIFTSDGLPSERDRIGARFTARHDQTGAKLGVYRIVGLVFYDRDGDVLRIEGDVPERKLAQATYK